MTQYIITSMNLTSPITVNSLLEAKRRITNLSYTIRETSPILKEGEKIGYEIECEDKYGYSSFFNVEIK